MSKRELNISNKKLHIDTKEDIIFRSPSRIPASELQTLISLNTIQGTNIAYYDISPTENQSIIYKEEINVDIWNMISPHSLLSKEERDQIMGEISNI